MKPTKEEILKNLTPIQFEVTQNAATEKPFTGEFDEFDEAGLYVDIVSGEPLFTSKDKFNAGCGWPAFAKPVNEEVIIEKEDLTRGRIRVEVRSKEGDSHLGHVFTDGPTELGGLRYCINSAALRFIPVEDLEKEGYVSYAALF